MGRAACKVGFVPVSLYPVSGKGSPWPSHGQAEVRSSRSMGFPSQPTHLPMAMPLFVLTIQCKCLRGSQLASSRLAVCAWVLKFFQGLSIADIHPPGWKGAWLQGSYVGPVPGTLGSIQGGERTQSHGNPPGCLCSELICLTQPTSLPLSWIIHQLLERNKRQSHFIFCRTHCPNLWPWRILKFTTGTLNSPTRFGKEQQSVPSFSPSRLAESCCEGVSAYLVFWLYFVPLLLIMKRTSMFLGLPLDGPDISIGT